jgi:hypothetical protein
MGIWSGSVRIDVAVINGELSGYELKSDRDTLGRLPTQAKIYSQVFDKMHLVVGARHEGRARRVVPRWWGVISATSGKDGVRLEPVREARPNPAPNPLTVARLLWRDEALAELEARDLAEGVRSKPVGRMHERLATVLDFPELADLVRAALKRREHWLRQSVGDEGQVAVHADLDPGCAAAGSDAWRTGGDLLDPLVRPALRL